MFLNKLHLDQIAFVAIKLLACFWLDVFTSLLGTISRVHKHSPQVFNSVEVLALGKPLSEA